MNKAGDKRFKRQEAGASGCFGGYSADDWLRACVVLLFFMNRRKSSTFPDRTRPKTNVPPFVQLIPNTQRRKTALSASDHEKSLENLQAEDNFRLADLATGTVRVDDIVKEIIKSGFEGVHGAESRRLYMLIRGTEVQAIRRKGRSIGSSTIVGTDRHLDPVSLTNLSIILSGHRTRKLMLAPKTYTADARLATKFSMLLGDDINNAKAAFIAAQSAVIEELSRDGYALAKAAARSE